MEAVFKQEALHLNKLEFSSPKDVCAKLGCKFGPVVQVKKKDVKG